MFVDELQIHAQAGNGGRGVVRWLREKWKPLGGPAGGNGGRGGDVLVRAVRDLGLLSKYTGAKVFRAKNGEDGGGKSRYGQDGTDCVIDLPVGSIITNTGTGKKYELLREGDVQKILSGGRGGLGNEYFKSSINRAPMSATPGELGEEGEFFIELELVVDAGLIGLPNAGKSSLLNALTNAHSRVGAYPFTTLEPHLGDLYGFVMADIPGLMEGASAGKGLGHTFLRHVRRTKMLLHCVSVEDDDPYAAYRTIQDELKKFDPAMEHKEEWIILTKADTRNTEELEKLTASFKKHREHVHAVSIYDDRSLKTFTDQLIGRLRTVGDSATISAHE